MEAALASLGWTQEIVLVHAHQDAIDQVVRIDARLAAGNRAGLDGTIANQNR